jgi:hypothetical protein
MTERKALVVAFDNSDKQFFALHPDRKAHVRLPYQGEAAAEFHSLGDHQRTRRRILLCRIGADDQFLPDNQIFKIPFLAFAGEEIEDTDEELVPLFRGIMEGAS